MDWKEILTLILSALSVAGSILAAVISGRTSKKVSQINNIKEYKENNRHITPFELQFRDEDWLYDIIITKDEFYKYDESSQKRITKWFQKYAATHKLKKFKVVNVDIKEEEEKVEVKATVKETTKKPKTSAKTTTQVIMPNFRGGKATIVNVDLPEAIIEARRQGLTGKATLHEYPIEDSTITPTPIITDLIDEFDEEDNKK